MENNIDLKIENTERIRIFDGTLDLPREKRIWLAVKVVETLLMDEDLNEEEQEYVDKIKR